ncbi:MAG: type II toxin-antitoxin system RelB/DinJ family antitoxin [Ottowia sp.]|nr:type II toxin-antitoxin system RelB/DinJ family antitoxin [Ottowia sp.]
MNTATATYVGANIDAQTWQRASVALAALGLTAADAISLTMNRIAEEGRLPFVSGAQPPAAGDAPATTDKTDWEETRARLAALNRAHDTGIHLTLEEIQQAIEGAYVARGMRGME